jgi:NAD(P)-dependent dehydrogenase (short-subunit alcohol dehydrogenase family)
MAKTIIITGSTRGIGYGLAEEFLKIGARVVISGRAQSSVDEALYKLSVRYPDENILGIACDMREFSQVRDLWAGAAAHFGKIDIWINNAGLGTAQTDFWDHPPKQIQDLVDTNITGAMFGAKIALGGFLEQGWGAFYNMEGLGSDGRWVEGLTLYGTSKRALQYLTESLAKEVEGTDVIVGALRPGMVLTDLILKRYEGRKPSEWSDARRIFNILADRVEVITPFLVKEILSNKKNGVVINWLKSGKVLWRFLTAPFSKRDLFSDLDGFGD